MRKSGRQSGRVFGRVEVYGVMVFVWSLWSYGRYGVYGVMVFMVFMELWCSVIREWSLWSGVDLEQNLERSWNRT